SDCRKRQPLVKGWTWRVEAPAATTQQQIATNETQKRARRRMAEGKILDVNQSLHEHGGTRATEAWTSVVLQERSFHDRRRRRCTGRWVCARHRAPFSTRLIAMDRQCGRCLR